MRINTNIASLNAQANNAQTNMTLNNSLEKLSSGLKINKAADDASGMSIADKLRTQASSIGQGISNANSASALIQIADKAMSEQSNILDIVKTKLIQATTSTTSEEGREAVRKDISKLLEQLDNISAQTTYNGINLLNTQNKEFNFQVGENSTDIISATTAYAVNTNGLGASEDVSSDVESQLSFGPTASSIALEGKTDITVYNASTIAGAPAALHSVVVNHSTSSTIFEAKGAATADKTSLELEGMADKLILNIPTNGSAHAGVTISTDDAAMISVLNGVAGTNGDLTGTDGTYQWTDLGTLAGVANGVIDFGSEIDLSKLTISNVTMSSDGSANTEIYIVGKEPVTVKQIASAETAISVDSATVNTQNVGTLTSTLQGSGSSNADGIRFSAEANVSMNIVDGTTTVKIDQTTGAVDQAQIAIGLNTVAETPAGTNNARDMSFTITGDNIKKLQLNTGTDSVTVTTDDATTRGLMSEMAKFNANLTEISDGTYQYTGTGGASADTALDFGATGVNLSNLTFSGVQAGTEGLYVETDESLSITKNGAISDQNVSIEAAAAGTVGTEMLIGVKTDVSAVSGSLAGLKSLGENELTAAVANDYMAKVDAAMSQLNSVRSDFGSTQNQLSAATRNMMVTKVNIQAAESVIRDVDYAAESANFNKQNIISQAGTYAMSQANNIQQNIMKLLQ